MTRAPPGRPPLRRCEGTQLASAELRDGVDRGGDLIHGDGVLDAVQPGFEPPPGAIVSADPTCLSTSLTELRAAAEREGSGVLFAGLTPRLLFNGLCVGATAPLRATGYYWVRDALILQLFDQAQSSGSIGLA